MAAQSVIDRAVRELVVSGSGLPCLAGDAVGVDRYVGSHSTAVLVGERALGGAVRATAQRGGTRGDAFISLAPVAGVSPFFVPLPEGYRIYMSDSCDPRHTWFWESGYRPSNYNSPFFRPTQLNVGSRTTPANAFRTVEATDVTDCFSGFLLESDWQFTTDFPRAREVVVVVGGLFGGGTPPTQTDVSWHDALLDYSVQFWPDTANNPVDHDLHDAATNLRLYAEAADWHSPHFNLAAISDVQRIPDELPETAWRSTLTLTVAVRRQTDLDDTPAERVGDIRLDTGAVRETLRLEV